ncbi:MAG: hypothetical protein ACE5HB_08550 [Terriglobia bacterium]
MSKKSLVAALVAGCLGVFLGGTLGGYSQEREVRLTALASQRADITEMDWLLMKAQLHTLQWMFYEDFANPIIPMGSRYDAESNRIISGHLVRPEWNRTTTLDLAKKKLRSTATTYCVQGVMVNLPLAQQTALLARKEVSKACKVDFYTLALGESGQLERKEVATFENGRLILK